MDVDHPAELTVFGATGARPVYSEAPRIRFKEAFTKLASQNERRQLLDSIAAGNRPPDGVVWVLAPAEKPLRNPFLTPVAHCRTIGADLTLYRAGG